MNKVAALYTCHNRKNKTIKSISSLIEALNQSNIQTLDIYVTDDGSTDGTFEIITQKFPEVKLIKGNGNLFWAEGMRVSWNEALKKKYDAYLLLNDDVELYPNFLNEIINTDKYCKEQYNTPGIYLGATENKNTGKLTYSGSLITNKFLYKRKRLSPNGEYQLCDLGNANIMYVPNNVVEKIGILSYGYSHGMADYDYTLSARKKNIPVIITKNYCGHCINDHRDHYENFENKTFEERKKILYSPTGLAFESYKKYMWKFFPFRYPFVVFFGWFKLYFPRVYTNYFKK